MRSVAVMLLLAGAGVPLSAGSQTSSSEPEQFLEGAWRTDPSNRVYAVSSGLPASIAATSIRFFSAYSQDGVDLAHVITTERGTTTASIPESGGAVVEGKNIELQQPATGTMLVSGGWRAVKQPIATTGFTKFGWAVYPGNRNSQVLDLAAPRQFVLTFLGHTNGPCNNGRVRLTVDGQPLNYRGRTPVLLTPGTSIWSYGKSLVVSWDGSCTVPNPAPVGASPLATGTIKLEI